MLVNICHSDTNFCLWSDFDNFNAMNFDFVAMNLKSQLEIAKKKLKHASTHIQYLEERVEIQIDIQIWKLSDSISLKKYMFTKELL